MMADTEETDLGEDYREPDVAAPEQVQVAAPPPVAPPGAYPVVPPGAYDPDAVRQNIQMRKMLNSMGNAPMAEAEQAVATAMKFQAIRGYQRDLAAGTPAHQALAKWAPVMFSQPKAGTLGQAASLVRATTPQEKYMDVGGVAYQLEGGKAKALTPPKAVKPKTIPLVLPADPDNPMSGGHITVQLPEDDPLVKKTMDRARSGPPPTPPEPPGVLSKIGDRVKNFFGGGAAPSVAAPSSAAPAPAPAATVTAPSPARSAKPTTPEEKVAAARALRAEHPDWTKKQILDAVNQMR